MKLRHRHRLARRALRLLRAVGEVAEDKPLREPRVRHRLRRLVGVAAMRRLPFRACWARFAWWRGKESIRRNAGGTACPTSAALKMQ